MEWPRSRQLYLTASRRRQRVEHVDRSGRLKPHLKTSNVDSRFAQALRSGTGLDLERLNVTPDELQRCGVCLVLDEARTNGDRLLVWTE